MEQSERKKLKEGLELFLNEGLERLTLSHPADPSGCSRCLRESLYFRQKNRWEGRHFIET